MENWPIKMEVSWVLFRGNMIEYDYIPTDTGNLIQLRKVTVNREIIELNGPFFLAMCNYQGYPWVNSATDVYCNPKYNPQYTPITKIYIRIYIYIYLYICILIICTLKIRRWESTGLQCRLVVLRDMCVWFKRTLNEWSWIYCQTPEQNKPLGCRSLGEYHFNSKMFTQGLLIRGH